MPFPRLPLIVAIALGACGGRSGADDWPPSGRQPTPSGGGGSSTGGQRAAGGTGAGCPGSGGRGMVRLKEGYCIDSTEVTRADYQAWLATSPSVRDQNQTDCGWNTSFAPDASCLGDAYVCQGSGCQDHPQVCINWCDAYAYCQSVGKRMCGKIGGGTIDFDDVTNPALSQWHNACTSHGQNIYPYGNTYDGQACNSKDRGVGTTVPVASLTGCQSGVTGYAGVYDLGGNAWEWEDSCSGTADTANCHLRGSTFMSDAKRCDDWGYTLRNNAYATFGIRCCSP